MEYISINPDAIYGFLVIIAIIISAILSIKGISSLIAEIILSKRLNSKKEETIQLFLNEYAKRTLEEKSIRFIYEQLIGRMFDYSFEDLLNSFMIYVRKNDTNGKQTREIEAIIDPILEKEREKKPYSKLEESERRLLSNIEVLARTTPGPTHDSIKNNLEDLAGVIERKQKVVNNAQKSKKRSTIISIIGVVLTVLNIVIVFIYKPTLSEKSIKEITRQIDSITRQNDQTETIYEWANDEVRD